MSFANRIDRLAKVFSLKISKIFTIWTFRFISKRFRRKFSSQRFVFRGKFANVYQCRLKNRQTVRAVKQLPKKGQRKTPIRLASKVLQLDHPNLVKKTTTNFIGNVSRFIVLGRSS